MNVVGEVVAHTVVDKVLENIKDKWEQGNCSYVVHAVGVQGGLF